MSNLFSFLDEKMSFYAQSCRISESLWESGSQPFSLMGFDFQKQTNQQTNKQFENWEWSLNSEPMMHLEGFFVKKRYTHGSVWL